MARGGTGNTTQQATLAEIGAQEILLPTRAETFEYVTDAAGVKAAMIELNDAPSVAFDIETAYVRGDGVHNGTVSLIQLGINAERQFVFDVFALHDPKILKPILTLLRRKDQRHTIHRQIFEQAYMWFHYGVRIGNPFCTEEGALLLRKFEDPKASSRLAAVLPRELGIEMSKDEQSSDWGQRPLSYKQRKYAAIDVAHLNELADIQEVRLREYGVWEEFQERCQGRFAKTLASIHNMQRYKDDDYLRVVAMVDRAQSVRELRQVTSELPTFVLAHHHRAKLHHQIDARIAKRKRR